MASIYAFRVLFLLSFLLPLLVAIEEKGHEAECPTSFDCGYLGKIQFPYTTTERTDCGLLAINGCGDPKANKTLGTNNGTLFGVIGISHSVSTEPIIFIRDLELHERLRDKSCEAFSNGYTLPLTFSPLASFNITNYGFFFKCNRTLHVRTPAGFFKFACSDSEICYGLPSPKSNESHSLKSACSIIKFPVKDLPYTEDPFTFVTSMVILQVRISDDCRKCHYDRAGQCRLDSNKIFYCHGDNKRRVLKPRLGLGLASGFAVVITIGLIVVLLMRRYNVSRFKNQSRDIYFDMYSNTNRECLNVNSGVRVFSYEELEKATNKFDPSRELGSGGFGTVYYGKLKDEREVAVKRLYESKRGHRRIKQFKNEIQILAHLHHRNLVSLYGCTSNHSRGLLLVYEYIPNGTVSSHLRGDKANPGSLPWSVRMKIAIETASALTYLHASGIIHRDVKTNNILLDNDFCVKVADFGISRLFPSDVSHVSTAPQGTPGYVDPEYYQCYRLSNKSDVYSFGVVLIELISSMAAVDHTRNIDEIKLANLATKKIQRREFTGLVDPSLGFETDNEITRKIVSVAELAFQCLQRDKEQRPSMHGVLKALQKIERGNDEPEHIEIHGASGQG